MADPSPPPGQSAQTVFSILIEEHADMLEVYIRSLLGHNQNVDDLFQETVLIAWRRLADFDRERSFGAWIRGIAWNLVMEHGRKGARAPTVASPEVLEGLQQFFARLDHSPRDSFADQLERLRTCLARLPGDMREAIDAIYQRGLSIAEAALSLDTAEETVKKRVQRARRAVGDCMTEQRSPA